MSYDFRERPEARHGPMTVWYDIVFVIISCAIMVICLYDYMVIWLCVYRARLDVGRGPMTGTYASVYDCFMC